MSGPDEISDADYNDLSPDDVDGILADEHFIDWPTPILVYPVELTAPEYTDEKLIALARQRLAMDRV